MMPQGGHRSPLPPHAEAAEGLSEHGHQKGPKEMERVGAGEPFPCTAAASAGTGAAEQERREGVVARPETFCKHRQGWKKILGKPLEYKVLYP